MALSEIWGRFVLLLRRLNGETIQTEADDGNPEGRAWARDQLTNDAGFNHGTDSMGDGGGYSGV